MSCCFRGRKLKDPGAVLDFVFDWSGWLTGGEDIIDHEITADGLTIDDSYSDGQVVTFWASGGDADTLAYVNCKIITNNVPERIDYRTGIIHIKEL